MSDNEIAAPREVHLHQFRYMYYGNGDVVQLLQKKQKDVTSIAEKARVYARWIHLIQKDTGHMPVKLVEFNSHYYAQMHGIVFNIDNGNIVVNPQIVNQF